MPVIGVDESYGANRAEVVVVEAARNLSASDLPPALNHRKLPTSFAGPARERGFRERFRRRGLVCLSSRLEESNDGEQPSDLMRRMEYLTLRAYS